MNARVDCYKLTIHESCKRGNKRGKKGGQGGKVGMEEGMQTFWEEDNVTEDMPGSYFDNFSPRAPMAVAGTGAPSSEIEQKLQLLVERSDMNWAYAIFWRTPSSLTAAMGWGDGYVRSPELSEIDAIMQAKKGSDVDKKQYERHMFLRELKSDEELQALVSDGASAECYKEHVTTDTEWLYMLSTFCIFQPAIETFATKSHVWLLKHEAEAFANKNYIWLEDGTPSNIMVNTRGDLLKMANIQSLVYVHTGSGVVELGSTELIPERDDIVENIKRRFPERNDGYCTSASHFREQELISLPPEFPCPPSTDIHGLTLQQDLRQQLLEMDATGKATSSVMQGDERDSSAATNSNVASLDCLSSDDFDIADKMLDFEQEVQRSIVEAQSLAVEVSGSNSLGFKEKTKPSVHASEQQQQPHLVVNVAESLRFPDMGYLMDMDNDSPGGDLTTASTAEGSHEGANHHQGFPPPKRWRDLEAADALASAYPLSRMDFEQEVELESEATFYEERDATTPLEVEDSPPRRRRGRKPKNDRQKPMSHKEAESLRRKKMKKQETALRHVVPDVSKADRASLLTAAISYIRKLESELLAQQKERNAADEESTARSPRISLQRTIDVSGTSTPPGMLQEPIQVNVDVLGLEALVRMQSPKSCGSVSLLSCLEDLKLEVRHVEMSLLTDSIVNHSVLVKMGKDNVFTGEQLMSALERMYQRRRSQQTRTDAERGLT